MLNFEAQFISQLITNRCGFKSFELVRYLRAWKISQEVGRSPISDRIPWITFQAISLLRKEIRYGAHIFEYGGGGSTLFFLDKGATVITIEHDETWFDDLSKAVSRDRLEKCWIGFHIPPDYGVSPNQLPHLDTQSYKSNSPRYRGKNFESYVRAIDPFPKKTFDIILIDGRARPSCIKRSVSKVKIGGYLILDNAEREYYLTADTLACLSNFRVVLDNCGPSPYVKFFTITNIWKRIR